MNNEITHETLLDDLHEKTRQEARKFIMDLINRNVILELFDEENTHETE